MMWWIPTSIDNPTEEWLSRMLLIPMGTESEVGAGVIFEPDIMAKKMGVTMSDIWTKHTERW